MITFEEALDIVVKAGRQMDVERVVLNDSLGRFLAEDVASDMDIPPFNKSAMDGFACRRGDPSSVLEVVETIAAGCSPTKKILPGQCSRIMTGAMVPEGADRVVRVEDTEKTDDGRIILKVIEQRDNVSFKGEDVRIGDIVLKKGNRIEPQHIAVMASVGCTEPVVFIRPKVGILSTGNEIVEPGFKPGSTQIRNSNAYQLIAQVTRAGAIANYLGIIPDDESETYNRLKIALTENDVVIMTGGVSMGDFDFIPGVFEKLGIDIRFRTIAMQPGKPTVFGLLGEKYIFGLPGNPVSSFNVFELLVRPLLSCMMGQSFSSGFLRLPLGTELKRKKSDRLSWIPVTISEGRVFSLEYHGSAHILSLVKANGIAAIPINVTELKTGELVDVRQI